MKKNIYFMWIVSILLLLGCSSPVALGHYSLEFFAPSSDNTTSLTQDSVGIEDFSSVKALDRNEVLLRTGETNQVLFATHSLWWALPKEIVSETFHNYLEAQNVFVHVVHYPTLQKIKYVVQGKVHRFEIRQGVDKWETVLAIQLYLIDAETQKIQWKSGVIESNLTCEADMDSAATSMEENLVRIYDLLLEKLKDFLKV
ncbi:ABC-type transport auxiliary lipoprotein family protein [Candidatus Uabimicrobium amorphum]|nr:ABC-type transport auxiliary lipoprotein family protein [Candidatus Uabimicrobium amorphum]